MDSANSSSLQSSSGGDEDFDSRVDSFSAFFHSSSALPPPQLPPQLLPSSSAGPNFLDYSSLFYLDPSTPLLPLDPAPSTSAPASALPLPPSVGIHPSSSTQPLRPDAQPGAAPPPPPRGSRKRSRASRRAPTTVLTTDTSNFRAMVQEFTGIPSPPFAAASHFGPRSRLDLFHTSSSSAAAAASSPPPFLLRPFPHKVQSPPPFASIFTNPTTTSPPPEYIANTNPLAIPPNPLLNFQPLIQPALLQPLPAMAGTINAKPSAGPAPSIRYTAIEDPQAPFLVGFANLAHMRPAAGSGNHTIGSSHLRPGSGVCKPSFLPSGASDQLDSTETAADRGEGVVEGWIHSNSD